MAAKQLSRLFTSVVARPKPGSAISECSPGRFICSSAKRFHLHEENLPDLAKTISKEEEEEKDKLQTENVNRESQNEDGGGEDGGASSDKQAKEIGGPKGPEPTRYGDWERGGRCSDF